MGDTITLRIVAIPLIAILAAVVHQLAFQWIPFGYLLRSAPHLFLPFQFVVVTLVGAVVAALLAAPSCLFYGRFAPIVAVLAAFPILWELRPWNSILHDFHWTGVQWVISIYEPTVLVLFILWFTTRGRQLRKIGPHSELERRTAPPTSEVGHKISPSNRD